MKQCGFTPILILVIVLILVAVGSAVYYFGTKNTSPVVNNSVLAPTASPSKFTPPTTIAAPDMKSTETTDANGIVTYISKVLGVTFQYAKAEGVTINESKSKICVDLKGDKVCSGQWVEIIDKPLTSTQILEEAINSKFFQGLSDKDCFVVNSNISDVKNKEIIKKAYISYTPKSPDDPFSHNCPEDYTTTNGIAYFAELKNKPDKFVFFSIGQYLVMAGNNSSWQDTFKFTQ